MVRRQRDDVDDDSRRGKSPRRPPHDKMARAHKRRRKRDKGLTQVNPEKE